MLFTHHACQVSSLEGLVARPVADVGQGEGGTTCVDPQSRKVLLQKGKDVNARWKNSNFVTSIDF